MSCCSLAQATFVPKRIVILNFDYVKYKNDFYAWVKLWDLDNSSIFYPVKQRVSWNNIWNGPNLNFFPTSFLDAVF